MPTSTSSLLASAATRRAKITQQENDLVAFEYSLSAKTYADYQSYSKFLNDRKAAAPDASSQLTYEKALIGAQKGYISNEIQRANIDVVEGRASNEDKYSRMVGLYHQAIDNNDYDLAQSLNLQLDNLSVKIQVDQQAKADAAQRVAASMANAGFTNLKDMVKQLEVGTEGMQLGDGTLVKPVALLNKELKDGNVENYFRDLYSTTKAIQNLVGDAYNGAADQATVNKFEQDDTLRSIINGDAKFATAAGNDGNTKNLTMQDIELAYRSAAANNPIYAAVRTVDPHTGKTAYSLKETKVDDFVWTRNDDGTYSATEARDLIKSSTNLDTQITDDGHIIGKGGVVNTGSTDKTGSYKAGKASKSNDKSLSIGNRLAAQGIQATQNGDGTLDLVLPGDVQTKGTIMPDGTVRYFGGQGQYSGDQAGLYEINTLTGTTREVAPDEASDFGNQSVFGGLLSQPSARGQNYIKNLQGLSPVQEVSPIDLRKGSITQIGARPFLQAPNGIGVVNDFSGNNSPVTARLLQGANFTQGNILKEKQAAIALQAQQEASARLQSNVNGFNLNQMPVAQYASNGAPIRQLTVAKPAAQPQLTVAPPSQQKLNGVKPVSGSLAPVAGGLKVLGNY